jgi:hypothetical protein
MNTSNSNLILVQVVVDGDKTHRWITHATQCNAVTALVSSMHQIKRGISLADAETIVRNGAGRVGGCSIAVRSI